MKENLNSNELTELFAAIASLQNIEESKNFLRDLCTISELKAMAERLQVAKLVKQGLPYREISKKVGASTATVTRVAQWLRNGRGGYATIIERLES